MSGVEEIAAFLGIIHFSAEFSKQVYQLIQGYHGAAQSLQSLCDIIHTFQNSLQTIVNLASSSVAPMTRTEQSLLSLVMGAAESCQDHIRRLQEKMPNTKKRNMITTAALMLELRFKEPEFREHRQSIQTYTEFIQLSMSAFSLRGISRIENRLEEILGQLVERVRRAQSDHRSRTTVGARSERSILSAAGGRSASQRRLSFDSGFTRILEVAKETASVRGNGSVADTQTGSAPPPTERNAAHESNLPSLPSHGETLPDRWSLPVLPPSPPSSAPPENDTIREDIAREELEVSKAKAEKLEAEGKYLQAAEQQEYSITLRNRLRPSEAFSLADEADMTEKLAELLLRCSTVARRRRAFNILKQLVWRVESHDEERNNHDRLGHLHFRLAQLYHQPRYIGLPSDAESERDGDVATDGLGRHSEKAIRHLARSNNPGIMASDDLHQATRLRVEHLKRIGNQIGAEAVDRWAASFIRRRASDPSSLRPDNRTGTVPLEGSAFHHHREQRRLGAAGSVLEWCRERHEDGCGQEPRTKCASDPYNEAFRFDQKMCGGRPSPFDIAIERGNASVVESMCAEVDLSDPRANDALSLAARFRRVSVAKVLLAHGGHEAVRGSQPSQETTALHACQLGDSHGGVRMAELLIHAASLAEMDLLDRRDEEGRTALFLAYRNGHQRMAARLLAHGADPQIPDHYGKTCLHLAIQVQHEAVRQSIDRPGPGRSGSARPAPAPPRRAVMLKMLLEHRGEGGGVDTNVVDSCDESPLHLASLLGDHDSVRRLLRAGAMVDMPAFGGETPLIAAAKRRHVLIVRLLLAWGANPSLRDAAEHDAFWWASGRRASMYCGSCREV